MSTRPFAARRGGLVLAAIAMLTIVIALPVLAADPGPSADASASPSADASASASAGASASTEPSASDSASAEPSSSAGTSPSPTTLGPASPVGTQEPTETAEPKETDESKDAEDEDGPEIEVTLTGVVGTTKDADGDTEYTLASGGKTYKLDAGPSWFFGDKHPLAGFVGKTVTIGGEQETDEIEVTTVDGTRIREPGKPPWAGGWKVVGKIHPGWSQEKWDRWQAKLQARLSDTGSARSRPTS